MTSLPTPEPLPLPTNTSSASPTPRPVPESLLSPGLEQVWAAARQRLDRYGPQRRGTITYPQLDPTSALAIESLLGRKSSKQIDLGDLETALVVRRVGTDLCDALTRLGHPPSAEATLRRAGRMQAEAARTALDRVIASWSEPWAASWAEGIVSAGLLSGLNGPAVEDLVANTRRLLDRLDHIEPSGSSRTELAATLFGSAHALDKGTKLAALVSHALRRRLSSFARGIQPLPDNRVDSSATQLNERELWEASGILTDRVSAPVLTWSVPVIGTSALDQQIRAANTGIVPLHISLVAMQKYPIRVPADSPVLVVENPRMVEAAADRNLANCVITTNGNPTTAVTTLLRQLQQAGATLWYHGDFDSSGIAICRRMHEFGCTPWMMKARDYSDAISLAKNNGVQLERDPKKCGTTPWDPELQTEFERRRLIIHEEFILDGVLDGFCRL